MPATFDASSTTDEVLDGVDLTGRRVLLTGASAGLGVETARALTDHGASVVAGVRDQAKATGALGAAGVPAGTVAVQDKATVTVKAVDPAVPSITVTTADGRTVTRMVEDKKNIEGVKAGDRIDITFTRALVTSIENPK